jgi:hypothetical protein
MAIIDTTAFAEETVIAIGEAIGHDLGEVKGCLQEQLRDVAELARSVAADFRDSPPGDAARADLERDIKRLTELSLKICDYYDQMVAQRAMEAVIKVFWSCLRKAWNVA